MKRFIVGLLAAVMGSTLLAGEAVGAEASTEAQLTDSVICEPSTQPRRVQRFRGGGRRGAVGRAWVEKKVEPERIPLTRFEVCADGLTVVDNQTGLVWEKKTGERGRSVTCGNVSCPDANHVNNFYRWAHPSVSEPEGGIFINFLARLNGTFDGSPCFADHCDWRLPEITELQTILVGMDAAEGQSRVCARGGNCIDPDFRNASDITDAGGVTSNAKYWSNTTLPNNRGEAWVAFQLVGRGGGVDIARKPHWAAVRAVRTGSCGAI